MAYLKMYGGRIQIGKTIDIYSAAVDTIYYMKNGVSVTVGTTDATGKLTVNKSALRNGTYTLYSSVAKDPSNLSNAYSKSVMVTGNTSEIYLMPDGYVLYWWGYRNNLESLSTANGWSAPSGWRFADPTYNTNYVQTNTEDSAQFSQFSGVGNVTSIPSEYRAGTASIIGLMNGENTGLGIRGRGTSSKNVIPDGGARTYDITSASIQKVSGSADEYIFVTGINARNGELFALYVTS